MSETPWKDLFPHGRGICYEGDDSEGFAAKIRQEFGFDPSSDPAWNQTWLNAGHTGMDDLWDDPFGRTHWFLCPRNISTPSMAATAGRWAPKESRTASPRLTFRAGGREELRLFKELDHSMTP
jgi:hypothetical protein